MSNESLTAGSHDAPFRNALTDCILPLLALAAYAVGFYLRWPMWEDQATYHYMAWGVLHGMRPYVDLVDVNFPGIIPVHVLARMISGADPLGLRLLDLLFCLGLCFGTSWLLTSWGVPRPVRLAAITAYLVSYFATGHFWTAQRESFAWPLLLAGFAPFLAARRPHSSLAWLVAGFATGSGLWIKPTLFPTYLWAAGAWFTSGLPSASNRWRHFILHTSGIVAVSLSFLLWLRSWDSLSGFWHWCLAYAFGAYHLSGWPWLIRFGQTAKRLWAYGAPGPSILWALGMLAVLRRREREALWIHRSHEVITSFGMCVLLLLIVLWQGKGHSVYQYIPLQWSVAVFGAVLLSSRTWGRAANALVPALCVCALAAVGAKVAHHPPSAPVPTDGTRMAAKVAPMLRPGETIVTFGFANTLLSALERPTPFPVISSWVLYSAAPPGHPGRQEIASLLCHSLQDPSVRFFLVRMGPTMRMNWFQVPPHKIIAGLPEVQSILASHYEPCQELNAFGFEAYQRRTPPSAPEVGPNSSEIPPPTSEHRRTQKRLP